MPVSNVNINILSISISDSEHKCFVTFPKTFDFF